MPRRKNYWLLFAVLLLSLTGLSSGMDLQSGDSALEPDVPRELPPGREVVRTEGGGILRVALSLSEKEFGVIKELSRKYTMDTGITVELDNQGSGAGGFDGREELLDKLTVGDSPDIVMADANEIRGLAQSGYLLPVDLYPRTQGSAPLNMLLPLLQWNGYSWGVPLDIDPYVMAYSRQALAAYGLNGIPDSLDGWKALLKGTEGNSARYVLALSSATPYGLAAFLAESQENTRALEWVEQARSRFYLTSQAGETLWQQLRQGTVAAAVVPLSDWRGSGLEVQVPLTASGKMPLASLKVRALMLSSQSSQPEAAAAWMAYVTSPEAQREWLADTGRLPAANEWYRSSFATDEVIKSKWLLTEEAAPGESGSGDWAKTVRATADLLTGRSGAEEYRAALSEETASAVSGTESARTAASAPPASAPPAVAPPVAGPSASPSSSSPVPPDIEAASL